ncbi:hypothetical protein SAY86_025647 [Trapa natans]|uniref:Uncharacterized protein n=1 Tax=Trapa natans TaxID=22666 RepID=A0AAN7KJR7_TRANT|nr:hypothetical protein SAY86_025647 [Trapa natans]
MEGGLSSSACPSGGGGSASASCMMMTTTMGGLYAGGIYSENLLSNYNHNYNNNTHGVRVFYPVMATTSSSSTASSLTTTTHHLNSHSSTSLHCHLPFSSPSNIQSQQPPSPTARTTPGVYFMEIDGCSGFSTTSLSPAKAKIMAHPHYHRLLTAYINCQKVGAPPEVVAKLEDACSAAATMGGGSANTVRIGEDPALDQFMEAYCEMLTKYEQELSKPFREAMIFLQRVESEFRALSLESSSEAVFNDGTERNGTLEEDGVNHNLVDCQAEDGELKSQLLQKYSGYLGSLKQEFMKKRKKGKLPKEARHQLLDWWTRHYKWPYPSESQKLALAETTGLDQKQINNWFINQRKRHWKPSEDMQFVVMDATHPHPHPPYYMDGVLGNPYTMDISPSIL